MEKEKYIPLEIEIIEWDDEDIIITSTREPNELIRIKAFQPFQPYEPYQIGGKEDGE